MTRPVVMGVDLNPSMCRKAKAHAEATGTTMECHEGRMEDILLPEASTDVVISNGVIDLSFRKRRVIEEMFRVLRPGGRVSITDIVSAKQLSQDIVNDPKVPGFRFRQQSTQNSAEAYGVKAVMMTAVKPEETD